MRRAMRQRMLVVGRHVIGDAGLARMHVGAAEILGRHHLAGRGLHQRRAAEEDGALPFHDDGLVRHRRHIGAAGGAGAHHHRDLRNAGGGQRRLVVEDAAEMLAVGKHLGLVRQVGAAGIDQIDARQPVLARDLLRAQMLLHRHRIVGAALDGGVVADDHAFAALDAADAGDQAGAVDGVVVHAVGGERRQFEERRAGIDQPHHALARQQLAARQMALARRAAGPPSAASARRRLQFVGKRAHARGIGGELRGTGVDGGFRSQRFPSAGILRRDATNEHLFSKEPVGKSPAAEHRVRAGVAVRDRPCSATRPRTSTGERQVLMKKLLLATVATIALVDRGAMAAEPSAQRRRQLTPK